ncbi:MAG: adenylosuccinate synthase [Pyrinomonadaceae bacterium]|nr:adenylosuccinate synthase [Phycisphaerales bacterium]
MTPHQATRTGTGPKSSTAHVRRRTCTAVVGLQWGDEGKGKVVDLIAPGFDAVARFNGGANAGHSVVVKGERFALHLIPSGILYPDKLAVVCNGVVVDPEAIIKECDGLMARGVSVDGLVLSDRAHVVMPYHKVEDELRERLLSGEDGESIGTTKRGIGPCYADKAHRATALRVGDLLDRGVLREKLETICRVKAALLGGSRDGLDPAFLTDWAGRLGDRLKPHVKDTTYLLHDLLHSGKRLLFEGANAALLDIDHGTHPFVTSSSCTSLGIPSGTGVPAQYLGEVIGVVKAYTSRVGNGPMATELLNDIGQGIRERGREFGTTTGRPRRVGWLDLVAVRYSAMISGATAISLTLLDVLSGMAELKVCVAYRRSGEESQRFTPDSRLLSGVEPVYHSLPGFQENISGVRTRAELPLAARKYVEFIEEYVGVPVKLIGVGPDRVQTIVEDLE